MAAVNLTIDARALPAVKLFVWEMLEVRDALRLLGLYEQAERIDDAIRRLAEGHGG